MREALGPNGDFSGNSFYPLGIPYSSMTGQTTGTTSIGGFISGTGSVDSKLNYVVVNGDLA